MPGPGRKFVKGQIANPLGGNSHNPIVRKFKRLTNEEITELMTVLLKTKPSELQHLVETQPSLLKTWLASAAKIGIEKGDISTLSWMLDRVIGKVKDRVELSRGKDEFESVTETKMIECFQKIG